MGRHVAIVFFVVFAVASSWAERSSGVEVETEIERIRSADRALLKAETERNLDGAMEHIAEDAVFQPPGAPPVTGKAAIRAFYAEYFNIPYVGFFADSDTVFVSSSLDHAYLLGNSHMDIKTADGELRLPGKYLTIWKKVEGRWLCAAASWSGNQPAH